MSALDPFLPQPSKAAQLRGSRFAQVAVELREEDGVVVPTGTGGGHGPLAVRVRLATDLAGLALCIPLRDGVLHTTSRRRVADKAGGQRRRLCVEVESDLAREELGDDAVQADALGPAGQEEVVDGVGGLRLDGA